MHVCGMRVVLSQFLCMQHAYNMDVLCVQLVCTVCAARKQIYVQHTSNNSVRASMGTLTIQWYCVCTQSHCIAIVTRARKRAGQCNRVGVLYHQKKIVIERTRDLIYLKFVATDFSPKISSENSGDSA